MCLHSHTHTKWGIWGELQCYPLFKHNLPTHPQSTSLIHTGWLTNEERERGSEQALINLKWAGDFFINLFWISVLSQCLIKVAGVSQTTCPLTLMQRHAWVFIAVNLTSKRYLLRTPWLHIWMHGASISLQVDGLCCKGADFVSEFGS